MENLPHTTMYNINKFLSFGGANMITLFLLFSGILLIGKVIPFLFKLFFAVIAFIFEAIGFMFLFAAIGVIGVVVFFTIDFVVLKLIMKVLLA